MVCWNVSYVVNFYRCSTWQIWLSCMQKACGMSSTECLVGMQLCIYLVSVNRLMYMLESFVVM